MFPLKDIICYLLQTPFNWWKDLDKGKPKDSLEIAAQKEKWGKLENHTTYILKVHGSVNINGYAIHLH